MDDGRSPPDRGVSPPVTGEHGLFFLVQRNILRGKDIYRSIIFVDRLTAGGIVAKQRIAGLITL